MSSIPPLVFILHQIGNKSIPSFTDVRTRVGYWLLVLATPFCGRAIPFHFISIQMMKYISLTCEAR